VRETPTVVFGLAGLSVSCGELSLDGLLSRKICGAVEVMEKTFTIQNKLGLHARASSCFVQEANRFDAEIFVVKGDQEVNGKSILGVLMLAAPKGAEITLKVEGDDALAAMEALGALINNLFGED